MKKTHYLFSTLFVFSLFFLFSSVYSYSLFAADSPFEDSTEFLLPFEEDNVKNVEPSAKPAQEGSDPYELEEAKWEEANAYSDPRIFRSLPATSMESSKVVEAKKDSSPVSVNVSKLTPSKKEEKNSWLQESEKTLLPLDGPIVKEKPVPNDEPIALAEPAPRANPLNERILAQLDEEESPDQQTILINFNDVNIIELIRFISKISEKNFYFDEDELDFNVTIISEEPTTIENVLMALLQELRIHGFRMIVQGDNIIIHQDDGTISPGTIKSESLPYTMDREADIVTQVFRLNTANAANVRAMIQPILSVSSIVEVLDDTNHLIITDIAGNVEKVSELVKSIDAPNSSLIIGQYVVRNAFMDTLLQNAELIMQSIAPGQTITFVPHYPSNSIFIVSTPFLVERAIPVLQRLDQVDGITGIYNLDELRYIPPELIRPGDVIGPEGILTPEGIEDRIEVGPDGQIRLVPQLPGYQGPALKGKWRLDANGNWYYDPDDQALDGEVDTSRPPEGYWRQDPQGNWEFVPGKAPTGYPVDSGPKGYWEMGPDSKWRYMLTPGESIYAGKKIRTASPAEGLPLGSIERTKFLIYKLNYRLGDTIETAMLKIADSMRETEAVNQSLIATINSVQWLEASNSLIFTGNPESLLKVKELVEEIDQPLRQVFIEMLILETSVDDSLQYSVNWGDKFRGDGGDVTGAQSFQSGSSIVSSVIDSAGVRGDQIGGAITGRYPDIRPIIQNQTGYSAGIIGQKLCLGGIEFSTLGSFVKAVHAKSDVNIVMNPKVLTEDNVTAEIFVGLNTRFKTQSVSNDEGSIITNNFEFRDVGTTLRVTPLLGPSDIITLQIEEEVSNVVGGLSGSDLSDDAAGPTTRINRTTTQVHIPDEYFLVISGMIQDQVERTRSHVPCLGGAPILGAAFTGKTYLDQKRCLMIFIRPKLIDTQKQINDITRHQQNIYRVKRQTKKMWKLDCQEALDWMNLKQTDTVNDERSCCDFKY